MRHALCYVGKSVGGGVASDDAASAGVHGDATPDAPSPLLLLKIFQGENCFLKWPDPVAFFAQQLSKT